MTNFPSNHVHGPFTRHTAEMDSHNWYTASAASPCGQHLVHPAGEFVLSLVEYCPKGFVVGLCILLFFQFVRSSDRFLPVATLLLDCVSYRHMTKAGSCSLVDFPARELTNQPIALASATVRSHTEWCR